MASLQLVARGAQDAFLEGNDMRESFFHGAYKQHTVFATEHKTTVLKGSTSFGGRCVLPVERSGDLVHHCMLFATLTKSAETSWYPMEHLCERVEILIGGQVIDSHSSTWFRVYDELYRPADERYAYKQMTNFGDGDPVGAVKTLFLPLLFWFCKDSSSALPMLSLGAHEVEIVVHVASHVPGIDMTIDPVLGITCEYVYLGEAERRLVAEAERTMLIEVLQQHDAPRSARVDLAFNHPCASLIWCCRGQAHGVFTNSGIPLEPREAEAPVESARLLIKGHERAAVRSGAWHRAIQSFRARERLPSAGIYVWDFCLAPGSRTPTGSINMSAMDGVALCLTYKDQPLPPPTLDTVTIFAPTWNWLVFSKGMAGLRYAS